MFLEKTDEKSSGFSINSLSPISLHDGLTSGVSCKLLTMGASIDEDIHVKSWMEGSLKISENKRGGLDRRESSFAKC